MEAQMERIRKQIEANEQAGIVPPTKEAKYDPNRRDSRPVEQDRGPEPLTDDELDRHERNKLFERGLGRNRKAS